MKTSTLPSYLYGFTALILCASISMACEEGSIPSIDDLPLPPIDEGKLLIDINPQSPEVNQTINITYDFTPNFDGIGTIWLLLEKRPENLEDSLWLFAPIEEVTCYGCAARYPSNGTELGSYLDYSFKKNVESKIEWKVQLNNGGSVKLIAGVVYDTINVNNISYTPLIGFEDSASGQSASFEFFKSVDFRVH